jgi:hypothetical protein
MPHILLKDEIHRAVRIRQLFYIILLSLSCRRELCFYCTYNLYIVSIVYHSSTANQIELQGIKRDEGVWNKYRNLFGSLVPSMGLETGRVRKSPQGS